MRISDLEAENRELKSRIHKLKNGNIEDALVNSDLNDISNLDELINLNSSGNANASGSKKKKKAFNGNGTANSAMSLDSCNSHMIKSDKKWKKPKKKIPGLDFSKIEIEESDEEEEDIDKMIEQAIEMELQEDPDIANQFETIEDFKRYIFEK